MSVILGRLSGAFLLNCELFALTLLFALPLGLVVAFGSMSRCRLLSGAANRAYRHRESSWVSSKVAAVMPGKISCAAFWQACAA